MYTDNLKYIWNDLVFLNLNFDKVKPYPLQINKIDFKSNNNINLKSFYRVDKMKFFGNRSIQDRSSVIYNKHITLHKIPTEAYEYIINGYNNVYITLYYTDD